MNGAFFTKIKIYLFGNSKRNEKKNINKIIVVQGCVIAFVIAHIIIASLKHAGDTIVSINEYLLRIFVSKYSKNSLN